METLAISVVVLILSGLGFITYRHPLIARKIIVITMIAVGAVLVANITYLVLANNSYVTWENNLFEWQPSISEIDNFDIDSIKSASKDSTDFNRILDSLNRQLIKVNRENNLKANVYYGVLNQLRKSADSMKEDIITALIYSVIGLIALVVLLIFSYVFQNLWKQNSNKNNKSSPETSN